MSDFDQPLSSHMVAPVHVLSPSQRLTSAARQLSELGISALPVVDARKRLIGVLERTDLLRVGRLRARPEAGEARFWWPDLSVAECMQTVVQVTSPEHTLRQCAQRMLERALPRVYVLAGDELIGVLGTRELMRAVQRAQLATPLSELVAEPAQLLSAQAPLSAACALLAASPERPLLLLADGAPVGVFARAELRASLEVAPQQPAAAYCDPSWIVLAADTAAAHAAERALAAKVRYIVTSAAHGRHHIVSGLAFAGCICGGAPLLPAAEGLPTVSLPAALPSSPGEAVLPPRAPPTVSLPPALQPAAAPGATPPSERRCEPERAALPEAPAERPRGSKQA